MQRNTAILTAAIAAVLLLATRRAQAAPVLSPHLDVQFGDTWHAAPEDVVEEEIPEAMSDFSDYDWLGVGLPTFEDYFAGPAMNDDANTAAFLFAIRMSEHYPSDVASGVDYQTFYGGSRFTNMADHPVNTGEKRGVPLTPEQCKRVGFASGKCVSTAAGAYQFIRPTWDRLRAIAPRLPDFSPASQDMAAIRLLDQIGALARIRAGDIAGAVRLASGSWASLPGSTAGQGGKSMDYVLNQYQAAGGSA